MTDSHDVQLPLSVITREIDVLRLALLQTFDPFLADGENPPSAPAILYHFTDSQGLFAILRSRRLWASLATELNDASEVKHAIDVAEEILRHRVDVNAPEDFCEYVLRYFDPRAVPTGHYLRADPYVVSLCRRNDQLLHWSYYASSGTGVAIGFESSQLCRNGFDLFPVRYDRDDQTRFLRRLIEASFKTVADLAPSMLYEARVGRCKIAADMTATYLRLLSPRMKHPAFSAEEEWRLLAHDLRSGKNGSPLNEFGKSATVLTRPRGNRVVPYVELHFDSLPITEIILGASCPISPDDQDLRKLLDESLPGKTIEITRSSVPIRP